MGKETQAFFLTILYFLLLAAPWLYSYNRQVFNAIFLTLLVILGFCLVAVIFFAMCSYFYSFLDE
jgi:hypothetical protein